MVSGFTLIEAKDLAHAVELALAARLRYRRVRRGPPGDEDGDVVGAARAVSPNRVSSGAQSGRLVAALTRVFGVHNLALAEDVMQDALCRALSVWQFSGVPDNPAAWLMAVATNRALDVLRRDRTARRFAPDLGLSPRQRVDARAHGGRPLRAARRDRRRAAHDVLVLAPGLPEEAQVALMLHILCGFSYAESPARSSATWPPPRSGSRARRRCSRRAALFELHAADLQKRLPPCTGRSTSCSTRATTALRPSRRARQPLPGGDAPRAAAPRASARAVPAHAPSVALMCLHAARLPARLDAAGDLIPLREQDRSPLGCRGSSRRGLPSRRVGHR